MNEADPDHEVIQFISDHLPTVPHLEAVLLIWQNASSIWTEATLASRVYVSTAVARVILEDFQRMGVLDAPANSQNEYLYNTRWDAERQLLPRLADLYRRQLVQVTKLIHSKGSSSVREFARAFQLKKDH